LREFVFSGRLDNLASSYQALTALIHTAGRSDQPPPESTPSQVNLVALFDHEEIGSVSAQGAASSLLPEILRRITATVVGAPKPEEMEDSMSRLLRHSYIVSADMAHALHPNYDTKHDPGLAPRMHGGLVLKHNVNQRYATNAVTAHIFRELGRRFAKVPFQEFAVRADSRCGSTIGPLVAGLTGVRTVDVGSPQWAMHSIRETMATSDVYHGYKHFCAVFDFFGAVANECRDMLER
jgi:aspartyl aminopeptidase